MNAFLLAGDHEDLLSHGTNDFIICPGYKGYVIRKYFSNHFLHQSSLIFDLRENKKNVLRKHAEPWQATLVNTSEQTMIGRRSKRISPFIRCSAFNSNPHLLRG